MPIGFGRLLSLERRTGQAEKPLDARILDEEVRASKWLADAGFASEWRLVALALSLIGWGISFWFGCRAIRRSDYGLRYNHARISAVRSPTDKAALDSLMNDEARASASSSRCLRREV